MKLNDKILLCIALTQASFVPNYPVSVPLVTKVVAPAAVVRDRLLGYNGLYDGYGYRGALGYNGLLGGYGGLYGGYGYRGALGYNGLLGGYGGFYGLQVNDIQLKAITVDYRSFTIFLSLQ
ncbi:hypothetical protein CEXT_330281 [Caerostris extrusa]|uniref:Uncharacterized protein n=1 Tax=Caerostris extrusa TaxID=172846 RepID=A0AAV4XHN3_CAEEX|nr:hypothetical protein CEXT_330281 [Caerostris extrusa]